MAPIASAPGIPITVIGGYLGAGKTTLLNRLLRDPGGRRLGVVVNDFGALAIDVDLLGGLDAGGRIDGLVSLPNGCVCCTLGADLYETLRTMAASESPPEHIVIEASGVADPAVAAAWGTSDGFEPGGVIVLAAADSVRRQARDRYVGGEVRRQLVGADLLVVTKLDVCTEEQAAAVASWLDGEAPGVPRVDAIDGDIPVDLVLGIRPDAAAGTPHAHHVAYESWSWVGGAVGDSTLERLRSDVPAGVLRLKGIVERPDGSHLAIQIVGRTPDSWCQAPAVRGSRVVAIGVRGRLDTAALDALFGA